MLGPFTWAEVFSIVQSIFDVAKIVLPAVF